MAAVPGRERSAKRRYNWRRQQLRGDSGCRVPRTGRPPECLECRPRAQARPASRWRSSEQFGSHRKLAPQNTRDQTTVKLRQIAAKVLEQKIQNDIFTIEKTSRTNGVSRPGAHILATGCRRARLAHSKGPFTRLKMTQRLLVVALLNRPLALQAAPPLTAPTSALCDFALSILSVRC